ncbi:MAG TPA: hypothetical protein VGP72_09255 [Planctomycetota bacterium]|jgi:hypothetical protein
MRSVLSTQHSALLFLIALTSICSAGQPAPTPAPTYADPVPRELITLKYRVCQDLEELTTRIDYLHRKPYPKVLSKTDGLMQPETVVFKDTISGHEITCLTRELCNDISHPDLGRPVWTCDGKRILFMGNRGYIDEGGNVKKDGWDGHKYIMNADYSQPRALMVAFKEENGTRRAAGIYGKFNIMDRKNPRYAYYAINEKLWRLTISEDLADSTAEIICELNTKENKIIQDISPDGTLLLIQDANGMIDKQTNKLNYMPEIHLVDLTKKAGEDGSYFHHPFDYQLPELKDPKGKIVHDKANNYRFHSLAFGANSKEIHWNYGPMTDVGEPLGYTLDVSKGLDGVPQHGEITASGGVNPWNQYESHGKMMGGGSPLGLYFSGPAKGSDGKDTGGWGIWIRDYSDKTKMPKFVLTGPGGHIAGGNSMHPDVWAAYMSAGWRTKIKESDCIVWGYATQGKGEVLCHTCSDVRGGLQKDKTGKYIKWSGMDNNDFRPYAAIPRPLLSPDATKLWFHSSMLMPCEEWVGGYVVVIRRPDPPRELTLAKDAKLVELRWQAAPIAFENKGYHVYRGDGDGKNFKELTDEAVSIAIKGEKGENLFVFSDATAEAGQTYSYAVTAEEWSGMESDTTSSLLVVAMDAKGPKVTATRDGVKDFDKTPPPPVTGFTVAKETDEDGQFRLKWEKSPARDLRHYNIYFAAKGQPQVGPKRLIASPRAMMTEYLDWTAPLKTPNVTYAITAVDRQGNESAPTVVGTGK